MRLATTLVLASALAVSAFSSPASADRRVALVVGNGSYQYATPLGNPTALRPSLDGRAPVPPT